ncbi:MAG: hypothetical protein ACXADD_18575 [Candidatus Thorarchaeota archaeon]|jgi:hypothetical protein
MKKKKVFRVLMTVKPSAILGKARSFEMAIGHFRFEDIIDEEMNVPMGLSITVTLEEEDLQTAISRARGTTDKMLALFSFLSTTSLPELKITKAYDVTPGKKRGEFVQYFYDLPLTTMSIRTINIDEIRKSVTTINKHDESNINRIFRSMHWLRLALQSRDVLERFASLWIGLETINPNLRDHFGLEIEYSTCPKCKHKFSPILNGVKYLLKDVTNDPKIWKQVRDLRTWTLHGIRDLSEITAKLREMVPKLERVLGHGLCLLVGLKKRKTDDALDLGDPIPSYYISTATVEGPDLKLVDSEITPSFDIDISLIPSDRRGQHHRFDAKGRIDDRFSFKDDTHTFYSRPQVGRITISEEPLEET